MDVPVQFQPVTEMINIIKPCDLCGGTDTVSHKHCGTDPQPIVKCRRCGLVYRNELLSDEEYREISSLDPLVFRDPSALKDREKSRLKLILDEIGSHKSDGRLLDIGCGHGFLLHEAKSRGYEVYGVDLQENSVKYAEGILGLNVLIGRIEEVSYPSDFFDVIVMSEVLEHMLCQSEALSEVNRILKPDGLVYIVVPNIDSVNAGTTPQWWSRYHFYYFGTNTLTKMLEKTGFTIKKLVINPHVPSSSRKLVLWKRFHWAIHLIRKLLSFSLARNLIKKIGSGSLTVIAHKQEADFEHLDS